jgi:outer membrane protein assembly factor BamD
MTRSTSEKKTSDLRPQASGAALLLVVLSACAGGKDAVDITKPVTGAEANNATRAYEKGLEEKKSQNFLEATRYFEWVRNNFPYSQYAALAELSLADMTYERDDYASAAAAYQDFVKSHPSHPKADYAAFRVGLAHYQDRPSDFFLLPPSSEKDESPVKAALDALNRFVISYPKSEYITKARDLIHDCRERLAAHERYVANFYWKREAWRGAAGRLIGLADTYGDLQGGRVKADSLWSAAQAWHNAKDLAAEKTALQRFLQEAPNDPRRRDAEARLKQIPAAPPPAPPAATPKIDELTPDRPLPTTPQPTPPPADQPPQPTAPGEPPRS